MSWELKAGAAGEHLVCADLFIRGFTATRTGIPGPWDIIAEVDRHLVKIQVKTTLAARPFPQERQRHVIGYTWQIRHGKGAGRKYADGLVDIFALVALDVRRIAYVISAERLQTFQIASPGFSKSPTAKTFDQYSWEITSAKL